jgi:hypothetical protein
MPPHPVAAEAQGHGGVRVRRSASTPSSSPPSRRLSTSPRSSPPPRVSTSRRSVDLHRVAMVSCIPSGAGSLVTSEAGDHAAEDRAVRRADDHRHGVRWGAQDLVTDRDLCWEDIPGVEVDVRRFQLEHTAALAAGGRDDADAAVGHAERAFAQYQGDLLPGCYAEWLPEFRAELRPRCAQLCALLGDWYMAQGRPDRALDASLRHPAGTPGTPGRGRVPRRDGAAGGVGRSCRGTSSGGSWTGECGTPGERLNAVGLVQGPGYFRARGHRAEGRRPPQGAPRRGGVDLRAT